MSPKGEFLPWRIPRLRCTDIAELTLADPRKLMARYNEAAAELNASGKERLSKWNTETLKAVGAE